MNRNKNKIKGQRKENQKIHTFPKLATSFPIHQLIDDLSSFDLLPESTDISPTFLVLLCRGSRLSLLEVFRLSDEVAGTVLRESVLLACKSLFFGSANLLLLEPSIFFPSLVEDCSALSVSPVSRHLCMGIGIFAGYPGLELAAGSPRSLADGLDLLGTPLKDDRVTSIGVLGCSERGLSVVSRCSPLPLSLSLLSDLVDPLASFPLFFSLSLLPDLSDAFPSPLSLSFRPPLSAHCSEVFPWLEG